MKIKFHQLFSLLQKFEDHIEHLEARVLELEQKIETLIQLERNHLVRVKNREEISDEFIQNGRSYYDLSPEKAWKLYNNKEFDFILIDVSSKEYAPKRRIKEALQIPWEDFQERFLEIQTKTTPLLIISEDGTNSILACEFLVNRGFYNCNNVSGGYKSWPGFRLEDVKDLTA